MNLRGLGVVAGTVAGGLLVASGPTAVWLVSANEFGDERDDGGEDRVRAEKTERPGLDPLDRRWDRPGRPYLKGGPGEGGLGEGLDELRELAAWTRCVLEQAREADGPVDLEEACGDEPELTGPPGLLEIPQTPEFQDS
jgi:hypothetical protein